MGGRGPPYWMKCLMCLAKIDEKSQFFIGNCRCILCSSCASKSKEKCVACVRAGSKYQPIGPKLPSHIREMFTPCEESLIKVKAKQEFQEDLYNKLIKRTRGSIEKSIKEKKEIDKEMESLDAEIKAMELKVAERKEEIAKCDSAIKKVQDRKRQQKQQKQNPRKQPKPDSVVARKLNHGGQTTNEQKLNNNHQGRNKPPVKNFQPAKGLNETMASEFSLCSMLNKTVDVRNVGMFNIKSDEDLLPTEEVEANVDLKQAKGSAGNGEQQEQTFQQPENPTSADTNVISGVNKSSKHSSEHTQKESAANASRDKLSHVDRRLNQRLAGNQSVDRTHDRTADRTHNRSADRTHSRSADRTHNRSADRTHNRSADRTHNRSADRTHNRSADRNLQKLVEKNLQRSLERNAQRSVERKTADVKEKGCDSEKNFFRYSKPAAQDLMKLKPTSVQDQGQAQQMKAQPQQDNVNLSDSQKKVNWQKQQQDLFNQKKHPSQSQGSYNPPVKQNSLQDQGFRPHVQPSHHGQVYSSQQAAHAYLARQGQSYSAQVQGHPQILYNHQKNQYHPPGFPVGSQGQYRPQLGHQCHQGHPYPSQQHQYSLHNVPPQPPVQQYPPPTLTRQQLQQFYDPQHKSGQQQQQSQQYNYHQPLENIVPKKGDNTLPPKVLFGPLNKKFKFKAKDTTQDK